MGLIFRMFDAFEIKTKIKTISWVHFVSPNIFSVGTGSWVYFVSSKRFHL